MLWLLAPFDFHDHRSLPPLKNLIVILAMLLGLTTSDAQEPPNPQIGFDVGNDFTVTPYFGHVTVNCRNYSESATANYYCRGEQFGPAYFPHFVSRSARDADEVALLATWEDGSQHKKSSAFDSSTGQSKKGFNLWIRTLFQRPLLTLGENQVHYTLKKDGTNVEEGDFNANVIREKSKTCYPKSYFSSNLSDCRDEASICRRYFDEEDRCY